MTPGEEGCEVARPGPAAQVRTRLAGLGRWYLVYKALKYAAIAALLIFA